MVSAGQWASSPSAVIVYVYIYTYLLLLLLLLFISIIVFFWYCYCLCVRLKDLSDVKFLFSCIVSHGVSWQVSHGSPLAACENTRECHELSILYTENTQECHEYTGNTREYSLLYNENIRECHECCTPRTLDRCHGCWRPQDAPLNRNWTNLPITLGWAGQSKYCWRGGGRVEALKSSNVPVAQVSEKTRHLVAVAVTCQDCQLWIIKSSSSLYTNYYYFLVLVAVTWQDCQLRNIKRIQPGLRPWEPCLGGDKEVARERNSLNAGKRSKKPTEQQQEDKQKHSTKLDVT